MISPSILRRTLPLALTAFFSSFNACAFRVWAVLAVLGSGFDYFRDSAFLLSVAAVCILPSLLLPALSGFIADRLPKRYIVIGVKLIELPLLLLLSETIHRTDAVYEGYGILFVILLFSLIRAFYVPAFEGLFPETFSERELSRSCGRISSVSTLGLVVGGIATPLAFYLNVCGWLLLGSICCGIVSAIRILPIASPVQVERELAYRFRDVLKKARARQRAGQ